MCDAMKLLPPYRNTWPSNDLLYRPRSEFPLSAERAEQHGRARKKRAPADSDLGPLKLDPENHYENDSGAFVQRLPVNYGQAGSIHAGGGNGGAKGEGDLALKDPEQAPGAAEGGQGVAIAACHAGHAPALLRPHTHTQAHMQEGSAPAQQPDACALEIAQQPAPLQHDDDTRARGEHEAVAGELCPHVCSELNGDGISALDGSSACNGDSYLTMGGGSVPGSVYISEPDSGEDCT